MLYCRFVWHLPPTPGIVEADERREEERVAGVSTPLLLREVPLNTPLPFREPFNTDLAPFSWELLFPTSLDPPLDELIPPEVNRVGVGFRTLLQVVG